MCAASVDKLCVVRRMPGAQQPRPARLDRTRPDRTRLDHARLDRARLDRARLDRTQADRARLGCARPLLVCVLLMRVVGFFAMSVSEHARTEVGFH